MVQLETAEALEQLEAIAAVDGVDGIFIGPADLAASLGFVGSPATRKSSLSSKGPLPEFAPAASRLAS